MEKDSDKNTAKQKEKNKMENRPATKKDVLGVKKNLQDFKKNTDRKFKEHDTKFERLEDMIIEFRADSLERFHNMPQQIIDRLIPVIRHEFKLMRENVFQHVDKRVDTRMAAREEYTAASIERLDQEATIAGGQIQRNGGRIDKVEKRVGVLERR